VWQQAHRNYEVAVDDDGAFSIAEVPEGSYHLAVTLRQPQAEGGAPIAGLSMDIDVPDRTAKANTSIELGSMQLAPKKALRLGDLAPPFEVKTVDGEPLRLADFRGKYVLLDFWATWCGPCVAETPFLKAAYKKFGGMDRFVMISLSLDNNPTAPKDFARQNGIKWIQGYLGVWSNSKVTPLYGVEGIPSIFLIGPDGKVLAKDLRGEAIRDTVGTALGND
jgi:thiol-disulfide isomerase/thioredoxin